jgi:hypothetical protein
LRLSDNNEKKLKEEGKKGKKKERKRYEVVLAGCPCQASSRRALSPINEK